MFGSPKKKNNPYTINTDFVNSIVKRMERDQREREKARRRYRRNF